MVGSVRIAASAAAFKCNPLYLAILGVMIIGAEVLFVYRQLVPWNLRVDLSDWDPESIVKEMDSRKPQNGTSTVRRSPPTQPDGMFNGYPIYFQSAESILSEIHCIGETNAEPWFWRRKGKKVDMNWATRSCHFSFLCLDTSTHEFVLRLPRHDVIFPSHIESQQTVFTNQSAQGHPFGVSIGGLNTKWTHEGYPKLQWFPRIDYYDPTVSSGPMDFYALPANVTLIPFHSLAAFNPGHLVWDDFLPLYTLMQIFELEESTDPLLIRYRLPGEGLWAGCDWKETVTRDCEFMLKKFGPLMVRNSDAIPITTQEPLRLSFRESQKSNLICAKQGLAGLGALTDHGVEKGHGWEQRDYHSMYNQGRGGQLWRFRNFMLRNLNVPVSTAPPVGPPYRIVFSEHSSRMGHRSMDFGEYVRGLQEAPDLQGIIEVVRVKMKDYSLQEQAELVTDAAMYVTGCGGGAVTATFLPRGASLLVFYSERGGVENNKASGKPARLDWDYFNNMAYTKVHWIPTPSTLFRRPFQDDLNLFLELVRHDLSLLQKAQQRLQE